MTDKESDRQSDSESQEPPEEAIRAEVDSTPNADRSHSERHEDAETASTASDRPASAEARDGGGAFVSITKDRGDLWRRALFMLLFSVLYGVAEFVTWVVVVVQFLVVLLTGSANEQLLRLGSSLSIYSYQVFRFLTFTGDEQPFPMSAWPEDEAQDSPWFEADD